MYKMLLYLQMSTQKSHCYEYWLKLWFSRTQGVQSLFDTRGRYIPISCNCKAQEICCMLLVKCKNEYLTKLRPTPLTSNSKDFLWNPGIFEIRISSIQIQFLVAHTQRPTCSKFSVIDKSFLGLLHSLQSCRWHPSSFNSTCCPICFLCSIWGWRNEAEFV